MPRRLSAMNDDPLLGVLEDVPHVLGGLAKLAEMYSG